MIIALTGRFDCQVGSDRVFGCDVITMGTNVRLKGDDVFACSELRTQTSRSKVTCKA